MRCQVCSANNADGVKFCTNCGMKLTEAQQSVNYSQNNTENAAQTAPSPSTQPMEAIIHSVNTEKHEPAENKSFIDEFMTPNIPKPNIAEAVNESEEKQVSTNEPAAQSDQTSDPGTVLQVNQAPNSGSVPQPNAAPSFNQVPRPNVALSFNQIPQPNAAPSFNHVSQPNAAPSFNHVSQPNAAPSFNHASQPNAVPSFNHASQPNAVPSFNHVSQPSSVPSFNHVSGSSQASGTNQAMNANFARINQMPANTNVQMNGTALTELPGNGLGSAGLVFGLLSFFNLLLLPLSFIYSFIGMILSGMGKSKAKRVGVKNTKATVGLTFSVITFILCVIAIAAIIVCVTVYTENFDEFMRDSARELANTLYKYVYHY